MNDLILLKNCKNLQDLAYLLGYTPRILSYTLFKRSILQPYTKFEIPKKSGGKRVILAPNKDLKKLQSALAELLDSCFNIIEKNRLENTSYTTCILSHGFRSKFKIDIPKSHKNREVLKTIDLKLGIYSNAFKHKNKKYVLNIDLKDFFTSITFNRIVGYFCKNENFLLDKRVAILIAQIATYREIRSSEGFLPQGSPSSPIISNLIAGILDNRLNNLAQRYKCTYTRYADDLTFSTNISTFPTELYDYENKVIGKKLNKIIKDSWFEINPSKTRLTHNQNRQEVTGLTVNKKVNISKNYYRYSRSMIHNFCINGTFTKSKLHNKPLVLNINSLTGITNYIFNIRNPNFEKSRTLRDLEDLSSIEKLYVSFNFHKYFSNNEQPNIICEGITDPLHLKNSWKNLNKDQLEYKITSLEEIKSLHEVMGLSNGVPNMTKFLRQYHKLHKSKYKNPQPCILLLDGDDEGEKLLTNISSSFKQKKSLDFYNFRDPSNSLLRVTHLINNLYIMQLPNGKCIEDIYDPSVLKLTLKGRIYNPSNNSFDTTTYYGKKDLIKKVIIPQKNSINFDSFNIIFDTILHIRLYSFFCSK
ncbi:retron Ec67 family RNA-directed DNA polymerase/endonuclease [Acinetobacter courvalinii]|uniref:RNA-directed DNA polymerase n=1 Tax=Acinetobacter courvalinii TaxID=280147 RepID=A0AA42L984_9GAMM|nr:retron Ec67 family RNA-directed DNA polymerase/endonuclease [Acinetobacter courvalinii]MDH0562869.1 retron Ec67 family RNA-directed DNA polymerase/endonuclease [Acinetobacter courvalinii]